MIRSVGRQVSETVLCGDVRRSIRRVAGAAALAVVLGTSASALADIDVVVANLGTEPATVNDDSSVDPGMGLSVTLPVSTHGPGEMRVEALDASQQCGAGSWAVQVTVFQASGSTSSSYQCVGLTAAEPHCLGVFLFDGSVNWRRVPWRQCADAQGHGSTFPLSQELMDLGQNSL